MDLSAIPALSPRKSRDYFDGPYRGKQALVDTTFDMDTCNAEPVMAIGSASKARHSIGVAMAGGNPKAGRHKDDFYATPKEVTIALLRRVAVLGPIWEPFCGDGAIARVLVEEGLQVVATDLVDRGYGDHGGGHDVFSYDRLLAPSVMSNPPFYLAEKIIRHVLPLKPHFFALLLKATFWNSKKGRKLFCSHRPSAVYALSWRPDFAAKGAPTMECSWMVWDSTGGNGTIFDVLERPEGMRDKVVSRKLARKKAVGPIAIDASL